MSTDIITRIKVFGLGQANRARTVLREAEAERAFWESTDVPTADPAIREERDLRDRKIIDEAEAKARPMLERAIEAARGLLLHRPGVEDRDPAFWHDKGYQALVRDAAKANLVVVEPTGEGPEDLQALEELLAGVE